MSDSREWIGQIYEAGMISFKPIYHILLMCFLSGSVKGFLDNTPQENIFGNSPWACINPICERYDVDGVETVDIRYTNVIAIGFFKCTICSMVYKQRYWRKKLSPLYIAEYGNIWINKMISCIQEKRLDIPTTAAVLKCKPHVVRWQMKNLGIKSMYRRQTGSEAEYKTQVLALCKQYDEVTSDILMLYAPQAYKYLYKFDLDWLHEHMTLKVDSKNQRGEDEEMLLRVQKAVISIYFDGMPKRQMTLGFIAVTAGYNLQTLDYLTAKRPLTKAYIDTVVESRTDWLRRRISTIAQERRIIGEKISIADVKREMSLKPNTFAKYENFLKELISELNGDD